MAVKRLFEGLLHYPTVADFSPGSEIRRFRAPQCLKNKRKVTMKRAAELARQISGLPASAG